VAGYSAVKLKNRDCKAHIAAKKDEIASRKIRRTFLRVLGCRWLIVYDILVPRALAKASSKPPWVQIKSKGFMYDVKRSIHLHCVVLLSKVLLSQFFFVLFFMT